MRGKTEKSPLLPLRIELVVTLKLLREARSCSVMRASLYTTRVSFGKLWVRERFRES